MTIKEKILNSIKPVIKESRFVAIDENKVTKLARKIRDYELPAWDNELQFLGSPEDTVQYYFLLDSLNFCFWGLKGQERWYYQKGKEWIKGYYAFSYALKQAVESDSKYLDAKYLSQISFAEFAQIFAGRNELLLMQERHEIVQENFSILLEKFEGKAAVLVREASHDVNNLVSLLLDNFPTFKGSATYKGREVYFLKRAQVFVSDINYALQGKGLGEFRNMADLAIFPDYKLPQLLEAEGVLLYQPELRERVAAEELIEPGSIEEIEIRAQTIYACELLIQALEQLGRRVTASELDWILWVKAKTTKFVLPYHRTLSIYY